MKAKSVRWDRHVARIGKRRGAYSFFFKENLRDRENLEKPSVDGRIIQNGSCREGTGRHGLDCSGSGQGQLESVVNALMNLRVT
jgi:hypothetical protein